MDKTFIYLSTQYLHATRFKTPIRNFDIVPKKKKSTPTWRLIRGHKKIEIAERAHTHLV